MIPQTIVPRVLFPTRDSLSVSVFPPHYSLTDRLYNYGYGGTERKKEVRTAGHRGKMTEWAGRLIFCCQRWQHIGYP